MGMFNSPVNRGIGYSLPVNANIPGMGGALAPQQQGGGIFGSYAPQAGGIFAALKDAASYLGGGGSSDNFANFQATNQQNQMRQQIMQGLTSEDPAQRQQAYMYANMMGLPTDGMQKMQAQQALPKLLQSMQPSPLSVPAAQANLPAVNGVPNNLNLPQLPTGQTAPGLGIREALSQSNSPELQSLYAPKLLDSDISAETKASEPYTLTPGASRFVGDQQISSVAAKPEALPDSVQIAQTLFPNDPAKQRDYLLKNQPANLRAISNYNAPKQNWQVLTDPKTQTQFRYDLDSGKATTLDGQPYTPQGAGKIGGGGQPRSAASMAAQMYVQEHPNATAQDVAQFAADYGRTVKATTAFGTGKQGDLLRSFNVAISHLNTLDGLVDALGNGDVQAVNKFSNAFAQQTGQPAPTSFDAAKAIVGDEIIKAIVGGGGALADRENAQNQISRANSPAQLRGVINTYKDLMGGQLRGLKKQYSDTTGRTDFDQRLSPEAIRELEPPKKMAGPLGALPKLGGQHPPEIENLLRKYGK